MQFTDHAILILIKMYSLEETILKINKELTMQFQIFSSP